MIIIMMIQRSRLQNGNFFSSCLGLATTVAKEHFLEFQVLNDIIRRVKPVTLIRERFSFSFVKIELETERLHKEREIHFYFSTSFQKCHSFLKRKSGQIFNTPFFFFFFLQIYFICFWE